MWVGCNLTYIGCRIRIENRSLTFSVELKIHIKTFPVLNISVLSFMFWQISSLPSPGPDWRRAELPPVMKLMMRKPIILWIWRWCASTIRQNTRHYQDILTYDPPLWMWGKWWLLYPGHTHNIVLRSATLGENINLGSSSLNLPISGNI